MDLFRLQGVHCFDRWHFTNIPFDPNHVLSECDTRVIQGENLYDDIIFGLNQAAKALQEKKAGPALSNLMLAMVLHFAADIHQPLHCCSHYNAQFPQGDRGGNLVRIPGQKSSLHALWDSGMGKFPDIRAPYTPAMLDQIAAFAEDLMKRYPAERYTSTCLKTFNPQSWADESAELARTVAYDFEKGQPLSDAYLQRGYEVASERVALAGYRLGALITSLQESLKQEQELQLAH